MRSRCQLRFEMRDVGGQTDGSFDSRSQAEETLDTTTRSPAVRKERQRRRISSEIDPSSEIGIRFDSIAVRCFGRFVLVGASSRDLRSAYAAYQQTDLARSLRTASADASHSLCCRVLIAECSCDC